MAYYVRCNELYHYGILGMKWGVRRYQNPDGTLTAAGRERYGSHIEKVKRKDLKQQIRNIGKKEGSKSAKFANERAVEATKKVNKSDIGQAKEFIDEMLQELNDSIPAGGRLVVDGELAAQINEVYAQYGRAITNEILSGDFKEKAGSLLLSDMGYDDTAEGRRLVTELLEEVLDEELSN